MLVGNDALAQISDINSAINKAGQQRMLSQRIAKAYFQIGQQIDVDRSKKVLDASIAVFDRQLVELKNCADAGNQGDLPQAGEFWLAYKDVLVGAVPSLENGSKVLAISEEVLALAHQATVELEKNQAPTSGRLVNISGRQRMLSQHMAKYSRPLPGVSLTVTACQSGKGAQSFSGALGTRRRR
ncbi:MAG: type IV pili methyl-accepting chemotaxis transducer N-terminal domain-containing protein [Betaproteobacteria bacterium]|nr:type IV pili methyl-accepting chemotaxis transducer N-terminal domain-containing protein [Betaproteobacteria bacterium]